MRLQAPAVARPLTCSNARFKGVYSALAKGEFNLPLLGPLNGDDRPY